MTYVLGLFFFREISCLTPYYESVLSLNFHQEHLGSCSASIYSIAFIAHKIAPPRLKSSSEVEEIWIRRDMDVRYDHGFINLHWLSCLCVKWVIIFLLDVIIQNNNKSEFSPGFTAKLFQLVQQQPPYRTPVPSGIFDAPHLLLKPAILLPWHVSEWRIEWVILVNGLTAHRLHMWGWITAGFQSVTSVKGLVIDSFWSLF